MMKPHEQFYAMQGHLMMLRTLLDLGNSINSQLIGRFPQQGEYIKSSQGLFVFKFCHFEHWQYPNDYDRIPVGERWYAIKERIEAELHANDWANLVLDGQIVRHYAY